MEHADERIKMPALALGTDRIFRLLFGICCSLLAVYPASSAPLRQPVTTPASVIPELASRADSGDPSARLQLKEFLVSADPASPGYDQALSWLQSSASQNKPDAQFVLGYLYEHGKSLPLDFSKAAENYCRAALQGYSPAETNLGALYRRGDGVPRDPAISFHWYQLAAQHGNRVAQQNLGAFYYLGYTTPVDYVEAANWFRASAIQGFAEGQNSLAYCYLKGIGVSRDDEQAAHWARLAAEQGHPRSEALLAYLYEQGKGLPLDYVAAYAWYSRAVATGDNSDLDRLKALSSVMTRKQLDEANSLISSPTLALRPGSASSIPVTRVPSPNP
jgi:TPR repeat protein